MAQNNYPPAAGAGQAVIGGQEMDRQAALAEITLEGMLASFESSLVTEQANAIEGFRKDNKQSNDELAFVKVNRQC